MSWFNKIRSDSRNSNPSSETGSLSSDGLPDRRPRKDTDPETCLEVFRNHWEQAYKIIQRDVDKGEKSSEDEINTVSHNFEQMVTLLAEEEGEQGQGMPGPILHFLLEHEILEKFCGWCHHYHGSRENLVTEELRMFEHLISQSHQLLLIHKPVIRPLLNLLAYCSDDYENPEIEGSLVLVLHQLCVSISKERVILESFFNMNADHGPTKFLIFSLLIPYIHREGKVGQQARDALLLIMTLSAKHPYIGQYIAENSDFCPVLATGLSGLYSDLPRKISIPSDDWCRITEHDIHRLQWMPMFLNSLEFCNAVAQIAHPLVRDQLIKYIYNGFLVPVLGPALHQDVSGLPTPLLDSPMFSNSREEVITATAYLDLFLRRISEPSLVKAFLMFIFTEKNDEIIILDSLITRINSSSKLCVVSLSLFHTLVDLNCEDVMFDLVFKYLIPCTHVMVSQRRSVRDQDTYSRSAEKFLSLRPTCCLPEIDSRKHNVGDLPGLVAPKPTNTSNSRKFFRSKKERSKTPPKPLSDPRIDPGSTSFPPGSFGSKLEHFETNYLDYLYDARIRVEKCCQACNSWQFPYDGETPVSSSLSMETAEESVMQTDFVNDKLLQGTDSSHVKAGEVSAAETGAKGDNLGKTCAKEDKSVRNSCDTNVENSKFSIVDSAIVGHDISDDMDIDIGKATMVEGKYATEEEFISMLEEKSSPADKSVSVEDSVNNLDTVLSSVSVSISLTSTPRKDQSMEADQGLSAFGGAEEMSTVYFDCESSQGEGDSEIFKSVNDTSYEVIDDATNNKTTNTNTTEFDIISSRQMDTTNNNDKEAASKSGNMTSFVDISKENVVDISSENTSKDPLLTEDSKLPKSVNTVSDDGMVISFNHFSQERKTASVPKMGILVSKTTTEDGAGKGDKSVRFSETTQVQTIAGLSSSRSLPVIGANISLMRKSAKPNIGPFLTALLLKLESMMQNSLPVNLMLTGLVSRLAVYAQPLLRSFLLNHNLVFQPTVKSLVQVLTTVRQRVDHYSYTVQNFEALLLRARRTLAQREGLLPDRGHSMSPSPEMNTKLRAATVSELPSKEKRHRTLSELLFRRNPNDKKNVTGPTTPASKGTKLEVLAGNKGMRYINRRPEFKTAISHVESVKTRNAVYCAIVLEEFVKELAALTQEHSILLREDEEL